MSKILRPLLARHEPAGSALFHIKSGIGAIVGTSLVGGMATLSHMPLLIAPLGSTAVLLFALPHSPLSQPANVVGGYLVAIAVSVLAGLLLPHAWWIATIGVGLVIALMPLLRVTHPPAGALPLLGMSAPMAPATLIEAVLLGVGCLLAVAVIHHRLPPRTHYPRPHP